MKFNLIALLPLPVMALLCIGYHQSSGIMSRYLMAAMGGGTSVVLSTRNHQKHEKTKPQQSSPAANLTSGASPSESPTESLINASANEPTNSSGASFPFARKQEQENLVSDDSSEKKIIPSLGVTTTNDPVHRTTPLASQQTIAALRPKTSLPVSSPAPSRAPLTPSTQRQPTVTTTETITREATKPKKLKRFYLIPLPEVTTWILENRAYKHHTRDAIDFYERTINENQAEMWIFRCLERHPSRTLDPKKANMFVISGCLHYWDRHHWNLLPQKNITNQELNTRTFQWQEALADMVVSRVMDKSKPHLVAIPTIWANYNDGGVKAVVKALLKDGVKDLWSLGFERNTMWQGGLPPERIIPVPYVVKQQSIKKKNRNKNEGIIASNRTGSYYHQQQPKTNRTSNFIFYAGDPRRGAQKGSGCDRSMVVPLANENNMDVQLIGWQDRGKRLTQEEYMHRMRTSDYCLIMCGDTPTSRSLASAFVHGCIPLVVGSRLRGLCEPPCHMGWGWTISGAEYPQLPFAEQVQWREFPEVEEQQFSANPAQVLQQTINSISNQGRSRLRAIMHQHREGFIYGWGNPVNSTAFGQAVTYAWDSFLDALDKQQSQNVQMKKAQ